MLILKPTFLLKDVELFWGCRHCSVCKGLLDVPHLTMSCFHCEELLLMLPLLSILEPEIQNHFLNFKLVFKLKHLRSWHSLILNRGSIQ